MSSLYVSCVQHRGKSLRDLISMPSDHWLSYYGMCVYCTNYFDEMRFHSGMLKIRHHTSSHTCEWRTRYSANSGQIAYAPLNSVSLEAIRSRHFATSDHFLNRRIVRPWDLTWCVVWDVSRIAREENSEKSATFLSLSEIIWMRDLLEYTMVLLGEWRRLKNFFMHLQPKQTDIRDSRAVFRSPVLFEVSCYRLDCARSCKLCAAWQVQNDSAVVISHS